MIPVTDHDLLDAFQCSVAGTCQLTSQVRECDESGCAYFCPDAAPYQLISGVQDRGAAVLPVPAAVRRFP